jgi:hypothetical protein
MKKLAISILLTAFSSTVLADNVIVTETQTWKSVPITIDPTTQVYTIQGTLPDEGDYYYTYSGYRCLTVKRDIEGVDATIYHANASSGNDIYCYPE